MAEDEDGGERSQAFRLLYEKTIQIPAETNLFTWCPTMDLMTFSPDSKSIWLYRMTGQLVWKVNLKGGNTEIAALTWKPDGEQICQCYTQYNVYTFLVQANC